MRTDPAVAGCQTMTTIADTPASIETTGESYRRMPHQPAYRDWAG